MNATSLIYLIVYAFLWLIALLFNLKNKKAWGVSTVIIVSYLFYATVSIILFLDKQQGYCNANLSLFPFFYLFGMMMIGLTPVLKYDRCNYREISSPSATYFNAFLYFYLILVIIRVPGIISSLPEGIRMIMLDSEGGQDLYMYTRENYVASDRQIANLAAILYGFFSDLGIFLLFYYLTLPHRKRWISILLSVSVVIKVLDALAHGQRTGPTMIVLTCIVSYFLMRHYMEFSIKKVVKKVAVLAILIVGIPFAFLTISRFGDSSTGALGSVESYMGQAPINFNMYGLDAGGIRYGDRTAAEFKRIIGFRDVPIDINSRRYKYHSLKIDDYYFYTYVGDFTIDYGPILAVIIFVVFSAVFVKITSSNSREKIPFYKMIWVYFAACVCVQGGMYLFTYSHLDNYKIIATFLTYLFFLFDYHNMQSRQII